MKKIFKKIKSRWYWLSIYFSPFEIPSIRWYFGKIKVGVPYFLPRKWIKGTPKMIHDAVIKKLDTVKSYNERNPSSKRNVPEYQTLFNEFANYQYAVPLKFGFSFCSLGWKTKWEATDYRYEWAPVISFVFFGYQIAATFVPNKKIREVLGTSSYWESWLYYFYDTDKSWSIAERLKKLSKNCSFKYKRSYFSDEKGEWVDEDVDLTKYIFKQKYQKYLCN